MAAPRTPAATASILAKGVKHTKWLPGAHHRTSRFPMTGTVQKLMQKTRDLIPLGDSICKYSQTAFVSPIGSPRGRLRQGATSLPSRL
jgi:hypothetical protein